MRVLIAEDDTTSRVILAEIVAQLGHEVVTAVNGQEAWAIFHREHVPLVISDWMMPDLDGIELIRRIRAENRARYTYVVLLTALGGKENYLEAMRAGADDFANKPLDSDQLHARLRVAERILGLRPEDLDDKEKVRQRLELIRTAGRDAAHLVSRLTEFYRPRDESEVFVAVDLNGVIRTAVALTEPRWKAQARSRGASVHVETDLHEAPRVEGNVSELRDVLMNLIFNAVDAMPQGGTLRIATELDGTRDTVLVTVEDTGTGMTPEVRRRCLEPFFTTKGERGTGLGLAMTYGVIKRHRGTIDVESQPGEGTTFRIRLPAGADRPVAPRQARVEAVLRPLRVLVVEDEPVPRQVVVEYLTGGGHIVETAMNGHQGLQRFQTGGFDVVITDRAMPQMNGQLAAAIEQMAPHKPAVIMLSGFGDEAGPAGELPPGVDFVLAKPVPLERLRDALRRLT